MLLPLASPWPSPSPSLPFTTSMSLNWNFGKWMVLALPLCFCCLVVLLFTSHRTVDSLCLAMSWLAYYVPWYLRIVPLCIISVMWSAVKLYVSQFLLRLVRPMFPDRSARIAFGWDKSFGWLHFTENYRKWKFLSVTKEEKFRKSFQNQNRAKKAENPENKDSRIEQRNEENNENKKSSL